MSADNPKESLRARVKALLVQPNGMLWIGMGSGQILLVELSTCQLLQVISPDCDSVRTMASVMIGTFPFCLFFIYFIVTQCITKYCAVTVTPTFVHLKNIP